MVANPRALSQFAGAFLRRSKTDALDAEVIVEFAKRMPFKPWTPPDPETLNLRAISRRIESMTKTATQEKNRLHAAGAFDEMSTVVRNDIEVNIRHLEKRIARLRDQALGMINSHPELARHFRHIVSIKGIADAAGSRSWPRSRCCPRTCRSASGSRMRGWIRGSSSPVRRSTSPHGSVGEGIVTSAVGSSCRQSSQYSTSHT